MLLLGLLISSDLSLGFAGTVLFTLCLTLLGDGFFIWLKLKFAFYEDECRVIRRCLSALSPKKHRKAIPENGRPEQAPALR